MSASWFNIIHTAYDLRSETGVWLDRLAERAHELVQGQGAMVYAYDASNPEEGIEIFGTGRVGVSDEFFEANLELNLQTKPDELRQIYHRGIFCTTVSELSESVQEMSDSTYNDYIAPIQADTFGLSASDPTFSGIGIAIPLSERTRLRNDVREAWCRVGVHLNAAWRLRRRLEQEHQQTEEQGELLEEAVERRLRAESAAENGREHEGLSLWKGLVDGRFTLIDRVDLDSRREYILVENDYGLVEPMGLTPRERQVVAHVVQGESNKWIAYQLGIATGSVSKLLARAQSRLGVDSRRELIWLYQKLTR